MTTVSKPLVPQIARIKALRDRLVKAEELVQEEKVHPVMGMPGYCVVEGSNEHYLVNQTCHCPDFVHRTDLIETYCKHRLAAMLYAEEHPQPLDKEELERKVNDLYN
jgi:predicted nucleic acid-binding Zn finger protein